MTDIVTRLRQTRADMLGTDAEQHYWDCHEAAGEIERLRLAIRRLAEQDATLSVVGGNVIVEMECQDSSQENFTLTDAEREAIKAGIANCEDITYGGPNDEEAAAVLRRLLERLG